MARLLLLALLALLALAAPAAAETYDARMPLIEQTIDHFYSGESHLAGYRWKAPTLEPETSLCDPVTGRAHYCAADTSISYDETSTRSAYAQFGDAGVGIVMAPEYGHAMQQALGLTDGLTNDEYELQADCFTGAWLGERSLDERQPITTPEIIKAARGMYGDDIQSLRAAQYGFTHYTLRHGAQACIESVHALPLL